MPKGNHGYLSSRGGKLLSLSKAKFGTKEYFKATISLFGRGLSSCLTATRNRPVSPGLDRGPRRATGNPIIKIGGCAIELPRPPHPPFYVSPFNKEPLLLSIPGDCQLRGGHPRKRGTVTPRECLPILRPSRLLTQHPLPQASSFLHRSCTLLDWGCRLRHGCVYRRDCWFPCMPSRPLLHCGTTKSNGRLEMASPEMSPLKGSISASGGYKRASRKGAPRRFPCEHPGCDKIYSRAEHLQRHELNRKTFPPPTHPQFSCHDPAMHPTEWIWLWFSTGYNFLCD